jgi:release factor glutamine methyltransferase
MTEAELVFTHILKRDRLSLILDRTRLLSAETGKRIAQILARRIAGEPVQYILGVADFMGYEFFVTPDVLIPRPETELLVEAAVRVIGSGPKPCRVLDLGCGSGCIAICLKKLRPEALVTALDVSGSALAVARRNAISLGADITFIENDLLKGAALDGLTFDVIATNPPYVPSEVIPGLQREVQREPLTAFDGGGDGLGMYRRIAQEAPLRLSPGGILLTELGAGQRQCVEEILHKRGGFEIIEVIKDYRSLDRILVARTTISTHG